MNSLSLFMTNNRDDTKNNKNQCDKSSSSKQQLIQFDPLFKYLFETKPKLITHHIQQVQNYTNFYSKQKTDNIIVSFSF
jgi:hypothetical protein